MNHSPPFSQAKPPRIHKHGRREPKFISHNLSRYLNQYPFPSVDAASASIRDQDVPPQPVQVPQSGIPSLSPAALKYEDFLDYQNAAADVPPFGQQAQGHHPYPPFLTSSSASYTFPAPSPNLCLPSESASVSPPLGSPNNFQYTFQDSATDVFVSDSEAMSSTESRVGSFDSYTGLDSSMAMSVGSQPSSIADDYVWPVVGSASDSPSMANDISGLALPEDFLQAAQNFASNSSNQIGFPQQPNTSPFDNIYMNWVGPNNAYETGYNHWVPVPVTQDAAKSLLPSELPHSPWTAEGLPHNLRSDAGCATFAPAGGSPYELYKIREEPQGSRQPDPVVFGPEPPSPMTEEEGDDWEVVHSCVGSTVHGSPQSDGLSWCHVDSSPQSSPSPGQITGHSHMFSTQAYEPQSGKPSRGRYRPLTKQQKQEAREVRKAKACWGCHLSKIKCSPCSLGTPCQNCDRLDGRRRFCYLSCFNDPLESLQTFVVPVYLTGHFDQTKIEAVISQNATSWGSYEMVIRMGWGYEKPLEAKVVVLALPSQSRLAHTHQTSQAREKTLVRKRSLPLGIPLASLADLSGQYQRMVRDIVRGDLGSYVPVPYDDQESDLPESLLRIICSFYSAGLAVGQECALLREAISIHVESTILERSLILDDDSKQRVEEHLGERYPPRTASSCASRQIKFAVFLAQREQVSKVLSEWGEMMWSSGKGKDTEKKWATSLSVLVMLILVVDKMVVSADLFCEGRIQQHGHDAGTERRAFAELVRLTERELFERCKEIFHTSFKTRRGGKEACNPIRDGLAVAFQGRTVPEGISRLAWDMQRAWRNFGTEIKASRARRGEDYGNAGRLAGVFLGDFFV